MRTWMKYWLPVALWMGFIFWMSTGSFSAAHTSRFIGPLLHFFFPQLPAPTLELVHGCIRKAGHVSEYLILGLLFFHALRGEAPQGWRLRWALGALVGVLLYALGDEFHQSLVASRTASLVDVGFDFSGGLLSQLLVLLWKRSGLPIRRRP